MRGCEVEGMLDQNGKVIEEGPDPKPDIAGDTRTYRVMLDQNQYQIDMDNVTAGQEVCKHKHCTCFAFSSTRILIPFCNFGILLVGCL